MIATTALLACATAAICLATDGGADQFRLFNPDQGLVVNVVPSYVRPYVVRAYTIEGVIMGSSTTYFPVTGPSSDNAFTLQVITGGVQEDRQILPHVCRNTGSTQDTNDTTCRSMNAITKTSSVSAGDAGCGHRKMMGPKNNRLVCCTMVILVLFHIKLVTPTNLRIHTRK